MCRMYDLVKENVKHPSKYLTDSDFKRCILSHVFGTLDLFSSDSTARGSQQNFDVNWWVVDSEFCIHFFQAYWTGFPEG